MTGSHPPDSGKDPGSQESQGNTFKLKLQIL